MLKRALLAIVIVFVAWTAMDFVIHAVLLGETYAATKELWRPEGEMKMGLLHVVTAICSVAFVTLYTMFVSPKSVMNGLRLGLLLGVWAGISMGYGTFSVMPIPYSLALSWFLGTLAECAVGGLIVGAVVKAAAGQASP